MTTASPIRALDRWSPSLAIFPDDVASILGRMAGRLKHALGNEAPMPRKRGVPEGYDGIARRGRLEHISLSEWALLDADPDELIRRLSSGEMSYLRRAHRAPHGDAMTLVLFDVGPAQLGAPRLLHLALLVVLAERAARRRSRLVFGTLQGAASDRHEGLDAPGVSSLLAARAHRAGSLEDLSRWRDALASESAAPALDERFIVGAAFTDPTSVKIAIEEPLDTPRTLRVEVTSPRTTRRELMLELPAPREALRVLRDPFAARVAEVPSSAVRLDPTTPPVFSGDGRRLFFRSGARALTQIQVPNSQRASVGSAVELRLPEGHTPIAIGRHRNRLKRTAVISRAAGGLYMHDFSKRGTGEPPRPLLLADGVSLPEHTSTLGVVVWRDESTSWLNLGSALLAIRAHTVVERHDLSVLCAVDSALSLSCVRALPSGAFRHVMAMSDGSLEEREVSLGGGHRHAVWSGSLPFPCAIGHTPTSYSYHSLPNESATISVSMADRCVAVTHGGILVLDRKHTEVALLTPKAKRAVLFTTARPVTAAVVSPSTSALCVVSSGGEVVIYRDVVVSRHVYPVSP